MNPVIDLILKNSEMKNKMSVLDELKLKEISDIRN